MSKRDRHLPRQKICQTISVIKTNTFDDIVSYHPIFFLIFVLLLLQNFLEYGLFVK